MCLDSPRGADNGTDTDSVQQSAILFFQMQPAVCQVSHTGSFRRPEILFPFFCPLFVIQESGISMLTKVPVIRANFC